MTVNIKLFAILRDRAGQSDLHLELPPGSTVAHAAQQLATSHPAIAPFISRIAFAVNQQYVPSTTVLQDNDELALIPPVSGGC
jgi:molybdopterin converting factor subunit 1